AAHDRGTCWCSRNAVAGSGRRTRPWASRFRAGNGGRKFCAPVDRGTGKAKAVHGRPHTDRRISADARDREGKDRGGGEDRSHPSSVAGLPAASKSGVVRVAKSCEG